MSLTHEPKCPRLAADAVLFRGFDVLLVCRRNEPFQRMWALPGGFVDVGEKTEDACLRELHEETGIRGLIVDLLGVYSDPKRDPRAHCVSVTYACAAREENPSARASDDAAEARWFGMDNLPPLAFDHAEILQDARVWYADGGREALRGARLAEGR